MSDKKLLYLAILAGEIMIKSTAEIYRANDTMERILHTGNYKKIDTFVSTNGLFASVETADGQLLTTVKTVKEASLQLAKIAAVNDVSRMLVDGKITIDDAHARLKQIAAEQTYSFAAILLGYGVAAASITYILGGAYLDSANSFLTTIALTFVMHFIGKKKVSSILLNIIGGISVGAVALALFQLGIGTQLDKIIGGAITPLISGMLFISAVRDFFEEDFLSGTIRLTDAMLKAVGIAAGVGIVLGIWNSIGGLL